MQKIRRVESEFTFVCDSDWREISYLPAFAVRILHLIFASPRDPVSSLLNFYEKAKQVPRLSSFPFLIHSALDCADHSGKAERK